MPCSQPVDLSRLGKPLENGGIAHRRHRVYNVDTF